MRGAERFQGLLAGAAVATALLTGGGRLREAEVAVIVQGRDLAAAAAAVRSAGGTVTHELGIIGAVGARLAPARLARLETRPDLRVYPDRPVRSAQAPEGSWTLRDQFGTVSFGNNDGTRAWAAAWTETGDDNRANSGNVLVSGGLLSLKRGSRGWARPADLAGASSATLTFSYRRDSLASTADYVMVQVSSDGGATWAEVFRIAGPGKDSALVGKSVDVTAHAAAGSVLRFFTSPNMGDKRVFVDNVQVAWVVPPPPPPPPPPLPYSFRDEFTQVAYNNNHGTHRWMIDWGETDFGPGAGPSYGYVTIVPYLGGNRLRMQHGGQSIYRDAALPPGATTARLSFLASRVSLEAGDYVSIQATRTRLSPWTEIGRIQGPANDAGFLSGSVDLTPYISASTSIQFRTQFGADDGLDAIYFDDVQIAYDGTYPQGDTYPGLTGAAQVHAGGIRGAGITVGVLDTGYWAHPLTDRSTSGAWRIRAQYDAFRNVVDTINGGVSTDVSGHGSHVSSIILNTQPADQGFYGVAPDAALVSIKAFDDNGASTYSTVIRALDWAVANRLTYNIRVLNCSFSAPPRSHYWEDPLNQAVMRAWQAGIVVVVSAGNSGPAPHSVGVPGNNPYVVTVGAMTDNWTASNGNDDKLASFSATGPTYEGFVKPDLVAPGGHVWALMPTYTRIAQAHPTFHNNGDYFTMSGTSQAAAVISGVAALMLQRDPSLSPDDVKCGLIATARPAVDPQGRKAYTVFQQGAGVVDAYAAVYGGHTGCANGGLDVAADLLGTRHFGGPANQDAAGNYYLMNSTGDGYTWNGQYNGANGYLWSDGYPWSNGYLWSDGYPWSNGYLWSDGYPWSNGYPWSTALTESMGINFWVSQE
jgi:hypothetical protein